MAGRICRREVVSYSFSTSNHNAIVDFDTKNRLYLILFLHQTTTVGDLNTEFGALYLILFLHQTTTLRAFWRLYRCCILFFFYIKPQLRVMKQTKVNGCILFFFYIKPQLIPLWCKIPLVVSYSFSTSNHNRFSFFVDGGGVVSYSFSTSNHNTLPDMSTSARLYLILFLHQTTTCKGMYARVMCCILFFFYIKPQPIRVRISLPVVVSYSFSTSNHNQDFHGHCGGEVVSYSFSTSNHNYTTTLQI